MVLWLSWNEIAAFNGNTYRKISCKDTTGSRGSDTPNHQVEVEVRAERELEFAGERELRFKEPYTTMSFFYRM